MKTDWLKKELHKQITLETDLIAFSTKLYEKGYSALDLIKLIEDGTIKVNENKKYDLLITFNKIRKEFRNEKLLILFIINFTFLDLETNLENISFM